MKTTFEDDIKRQQLARGFAAFVMEIVRNNIERGVYRVSRRTDT